MQPSRVLSRSPHPYTRVPKPSKTPSDSGTEADDESTGVLKGLPAPPARPRKGLEDGSKRSSDGQDKKKTVEKRPEVLRRLCEVALVLGVGVVVFRPVEVRDVAWVWRGELLVHALLVAALYLFYPLNLPLAKFTIPASFDPAPLLYPIAIPVFAALSLTQQRPTLVLPNIVLGLSSLPAPVVPLHSWRHGYSISHWTVTLVPIVVAEFVASKPLALYGLDAEALTLIYPLQQALIPVLDFLLATSLLPAEVQLLASALINLLLFASSPQAHILKALLWLGALCIFVLCRHVLRWEVALARIPSWRFRRYPTSSQSRRTLLNDMDHAFCEQLSPGEVPGSDSEVERVPARRTFDMTQKQDQEQEQQQQDQKPARRHTISAVEEPKVNTRETAKGRRKRVMAPELASLLSLTVSQAQVRKWLYAAYVYLAIAAIIMLPVRKYVSDQALAGNEPFGWALGYLFGNLPMFRFWVVMMNREYWIKLPVRHDDSSCTSCAYGWVEHVRHDSFGEANTRLLLCAYCSVVVLTGLAVVFKLSSLAAVDTRRKVFHGMMVLMFLPTIYIDPNFCALALGTVLAIFLLLDLFRASQLPPISRPLTYFLAPYVDGRDHRGPVIVSHIFLLIGCSIPLWLSLADLPRSGNASGSGTTATDPAIDPWTGWDVLSRDTSMVSGVICVGMGDAAASLIGRRFGRRKWFWGGGKSLEGSIAFAVAVFIGLMVARAWLVFGGWPSSVASGAGAGAGTASGIDYAWLALRALLAAAGTSITEAILTGCNDNVAVPVVLWLLVRGMRV